MNESDNTSREGRTADGTQSLKPLTDWVNEPSVRDLKQELNDAKPDHDTQVIKIGTWLDNLNVTGAAKMKPVKGRSSIVPKLIRKQAEWRYAALSEPFLSTDDVFNIDPVTFEDKKGAQQNQLVLNNQFNTKLNKVKLIDDYVRTAVDEGTVIARVGWAFEEEERTRLEPKYTFVHSPESLAQHQQLHQLMQEAPEQYAEQVPLPLQQAHQITMETRQPVIPVQDGFEEVTYMATVKNQPTVDICNYRNVTIDPTANGDIEKASFITYSFESSLAQLRKDGKYVNLDRINAEGASVLSEPDHAGRDESAFNFTDEPRKKLVVYEYWGFWDIDGTGQVKPIVAAWVGGTMIRLEENPYPDQKLPFVIVPYLPVRGSLYGEPDGELLTDNQKVIGAVTRGMIDIMGRSANGQTGIRKDALDVTNRRKYENGQDYEYNQSVDPRLGFYMHTYPEIPNSAQVMLQLQNQEAESLTGVKSFNSGISGQSLGDVAAGVRGALDAASKRELGILRRLADGMVQIGRKIIAMNAEFLEEEEVVRVTNEEFVAVRRDDLPGNYDLKLSISTAEEDNQKAQELSFMLQTVGPNTDPKITFMIMADIARLRKMPDLAKRLEEYEPQPDPLAQEKAMLEIELLKAQIAKTQAEAIENQAEAHLDQAKAVTEQAKASNLQSDTDIKNLDFVEQESGVKQERELQKQGEQAKSNAKLEMVKSALNPKTPA
jgi:hypothetical protein